MAWWHTPDSRSPTANDMDERRSLIVTTSFPPDQGGVATLLGNVARSLDRAPFVLAPAVAGPQEAASPNGLDCHWIRLSHPGLVGRLRYQLLWSTHPCLYYLWHFWRPAAGLAKAHPVSAVQCGHVYVGLLGLALKLRLGIPYVVYAYAQEIRRTRAVGVPVLDAMLRATVLRQAAAVFVLSDYTRARVLEWGVQPERVAHLPAGGAIQAMSPSEQEPPLSFTHPTLLTVARLVPRKGIDAVIQALPRVLEAFPMAQYVVVGSGPDETRLRQLARATGVERCVIFAGRVNEARLPAYYAACDLFVMPARDADDGEVEGLGLVFLEAASFGKPALAGRSGGMPDAVLEGVTGSLVDPDDPNAVASGLLDLLGDRERLERMGRAARERVERECTWERTARRVEAVLEQVARGELPE